MRALLFSCPDSHGSVRATHRSVPRHRIARSGLAIESNFACATSIVIVRTVPVGSEISCSPQPAMSGENTASQRQGSLISLVISSASANSSLISKKCRYAEPYNRRGLALGIPTGSIIINPLIICIIRAISPLIICIIEAMGKAPHSLPKPCYCCLLPLLFAICDVPPLSLLPQSASDRAL